MGMAPDYVMDSRASTGAFRWISASELENRSVHMIHSPYHHNIHFFIFLSC